MGIISIDPNAWAGALKGFLTWVGGQWQAATGLHPGWLVITVVAVLLLCLVLWAKK